MNRLAFGNTSLLFLISALLCLAVADIAITALNPWGEMLRLLRGILRPDVLSIEAWSVVWTVAFAVVGVGIGATAGFLLAIAFPHFAAVRVSAVGAALDPRAVLGAAPDPGVRPRPGHRACWPSPFPMPASSPRSSPR